MGWVTLSTGKKVFKVYGWRDRLWLIGSYLLLILVAGCIGGATVAFALK